MLILMNNAASLMSNLESSSMETLYSSTGISPAPYPGAYTLLTPAFYSGSFGVGAVLLWRLDFFLFEMNPLEKKGGEI